MNKLLFGLSLLLFSLGSQAQFINFNFETNAWMSFIQIDTLNPSNSWEVGTPQKNTIHSAHSIPKAIITDSVQAYPINDSSSFILSYPAGFGFLGNHTVNLSFFYKVDTDSLNDYGTIEFSPDNGTNWINPLDSIYDTLIIWGGPKPILTGNSGGWNFFQANFAGLGRVYSINSGDTVHFRFTFHSDTTIDSLDGIAYDGFQILDYVEGIENNYISRFYSTVLPNPAQDQLKIEIYENAATSYQLKIYDQNGQLFISKDLSINMLSIDVSNLSEGVYFYQLVDQTSGEWSSGKFIKN